MQLCNRDHYAAALLPPHFVGFVRPAEDIGEGEEEIIDAGPEAVREYVAQLLAVMQDKAEDRGGVASLGQSVPQYILCLLCCAVLCCAVLPGKLPVEGWAWHKSNRAPCLLDM